MTCFITSRPKRLELTSAEEITIMENLDIFATNGFGLTVDEDAPYGQGKKIRLNAKPVCKGTLFDESGMCSRPFLLKYWVRPSLTRRCHRFA